MKQLKQVLCMGIVVAVLTGSLVHCRAAGLKVQSSAYDFCLQFDEFCDQFYLNSDTASGLLTGTSDGCIFGGTPYPVTAGPYNNGWFLYLDFDGTGEYQKGNYGVVIGSGVTGELNGVYGGTAFGPIPVNLKTCEDGDDEPFSVGAFSYVDPKADDYHPLSKTTTDFVKSEELALFYHDTDQGIYGEILDDEINGQASITTLSESAFNFDAGITDGVSGDFDGDGRDEIAVIGISGGEIRLTVINTGASGGLVQDKSFIALDSADGNYETGDIAVGDLDFDGRDEIIVAGRRSDGDYGGSVSVFDDGSNGYALLITQDYAYNIYGIAVAAGNIDDDEADELIVQTARPNGSGYNLEGFVHDDHTAGYAVIKQWDKNSSDPYFAQYINYSYLDPLYVTVGNVDDDDANEIVFMEGGYGCAYDGSANGAAFEKVETVSAADYLGTNVTATDYRIVKTDMNGDGIIELVVAIQCAAAVYSFADYYWVIRAYIFNHDQTQYNDSTIFVATIDVGGAKEDAYGLGIAAMDNNRDGQDEFTVTTQAISIGDNFTRSVYQYHAVLSGSSLYIKESGSWSDSIVQKTTQDVSFQPIVVAGDFDGDNFKVKYTGNKWLSLPDPQIIMVMAAPPVQAGISQNYNETGSAYGTEVSTGSSNTHEVAVSNSITLSFEVGDPLGIVSAEASVTMEEEFTKTQTEAQDTTYGTSYASAYPDDVVIFQGTLYHSYEYEILAHPENPALIGTAMTIDVPVSKKIFKWTVDYYNSALPDVADIGAETFTHTPGDVASYPTAQEKEDILSQAGSDKGWQTAQTTVGQGSATNKAYINLSKQSTSGESFSVGVSMEAGVAVGGVGFSSSVGYKNTTVYEVTIGSQVAYEGDVGDISDAGDYNQYSYDFGMFIYNFQPDEGTGYQVLNYWVSDLGPGY